MPDTIKVVGRTLEVRRMLAARVGKPTIVFLHEGLGSLALWRSFPNEVAAATGCGTLIVSRYGNGFSDVLDAPREVDYMHQEAKALTELLTSYGIERPLLYGHSDGASIALIYAARGAKIAGAILEAPHVFVEEESIQSIAAIRKQYEETSLRARIAEHHTDGDLTFYGWNDIWLSPAFRSWNIEALLPSITAPLLLIQGENDQYGTTAQLVSITTNVNSKRLERIILADCAHAPHRDRPKEVLAVVKHFASQL